MLLVTGITGHTGKYFLQELINNNYEGPIKCVVRSSSDTSMLDSSGLDIEKVVGDLNNREFIYSIMDDVDEILHIYNIHHSPIIVEAAIRNKVKRVILVHTTGIYSNYKNASKEYKKIERVVNELKRQSNSNIDITILRPSMIYGDLCDANISKFIRMVDLLKFIPIINGGENLIQPVNARDLGKAYYSVLMRPTETANKVYDITGDRPIRIIDALKLISKELEKNNIFISVPLSLGVLIARIVKYFTLGKIDYVEKVQRMGEDRSYSHFDATKDFNYRPMKFEEGIKIEVAQYLEAKGKK